MDIDFAILAVFTDNELKFHGNTAAVVYLDNAVSAKTMQQLAADFNQPATTFLWEEKETINVRWFAPDGEIELCGHGALAAIAFLDDNENILLKYKGGQISGKKINKTKFSIFLEPIISYEAGTPDDSIKKGLMVEPREYHSNQNKNILLLETEEEVQKLNPDFNILKAMEPFGLIVTAPGDSVDFVSRTFVPKVRQLEDHATGSSHAALVPFWFDKLKKDKMTAHQLSPRGGKFECEFGDNRVMLTGETHVIVRGKLL